MKKLNVILAIMMITMSVFAQKGHHRMDLDKMKTELNLSDEQVEALEANRAEIKQKMEAIRNDAQLDHKAKKEAIKALHESKKGSLEAILTEDQQAKMLTHRKAKHAERQAKKEEHRAARKQTHAELKSYRQQNIQPVMQQKRLDFDKKIAAADKVEIEKLRLISADLKAEMKEKMKRRKNKKSAEEGRGKIGKHHARRSHKKGHRFLALLKEKDEATYNSAIALAEKYGEAIDDMHQSMESQRQAWNEDMKEIKLQKMSEEKRAKIEEKIAKRKEKQEEKPKLNGEKLVAKRLGFLLMPLEAQNASGHINAPRLNTYPNPTDGRNTLEFEVRQPGNVKIDLFSIDGKYIRTVLDENLQSGEHKIDLDLSSLENKMYYYNITDKTGTYTKKVIVK